MVWQREALGFNVKGIAENLGVDSSTVRRTLALFSATGDVQKKPYPTERAFRVITEPVKFFIIHLVLDQPGIFLREVKSTLEVELGVDVTESAICKFLKKAGFTGLHLATYALQRNEDLRSIFSAELAQYKTHTLVFVHETGTDRRDGNRKIGYSMQGHSIKAQKLFVRGKHISVLTAMSVQGILALHIVRGGVDADKYYDFLCRHLQIFMPFDGDNEHSVVVLDNCSIHHVRGMDEILQDVGVIVQYLTPYSPDLNPIEEAFSKVK